MLREDRRASFEAERSIFGRRFRFVAGTFESAGALSPRAHAEIIARQETEAVLVMEADGRHWWIFRGRTFWEDEALTEEDVRALAIAAGQRRERKLRRAHDLLAGAGPRRESLPEELRRRVFRRDGGACVQCGARELIQFDHVIPVALGGATTLANLQILCAGCNREKSDAI